MSPAVGVPLHFTVEALGLGVAGVAAAWAALSRRFIAAAGALLLVGAQVAYAGQFFASGSGTSAAVGAVRLAGLGLLAVGAWTQAFGPVGAAGAGFVAGGTIWRLVTSAGAASLAGGARGLEAAGFLLLAVWAWRRASASVRSRIVAAFIAVLSAAVIVMGGAAARVSVTSAIDSAQVRLVEAARSEQRVIAERTTGLASRAALASAVVTQLGPSTATIATLRARAFADADIVSFVAGDRVIGTQAAALRASGAVAAARSGRAATGFLGGAESAVVVAQPVFRSAVQRSAADVVGVLAVGEGLSVQELSADSSRATPGVSADLRTVGGFTAQTPVRGGRTRVDGVDRIVAVAPLELSEPPPIEIVLSAAVSAATETATAFPRALVGGVLVAAMLAVVLALWLSSRIARPILQLADEAERVKTDFLSTISHELRTPLTPIRGYADLLRRGRVPRRRQEVYLDEIDDAARRLERIVTLLVEVAAIEAGRFTLETQPVAAAEVLTSVAERWRLRSPRHTFTVRAPKSLPGAIADERAITRVIDELVDNAVKFSPTGGPIELRARRTSGGVEIAVSDEGIGLEPAALEQLTAAFVQADPGETRRFGGLGLGLTFAAGVVAVHGGRLDVHGEKDGGTTFSFTLPAVGMVTPMSGRDRRDDSVTN